MSHKEEQELRWCLWAIESAYRAGLTLPSCLRLVLAFTDGKPFIHIIKGVHHG